MTDQNKADDDDLEDKLPEPPVWVKHGLPLPRLQLTWEKLPEPEDGYNWLCKYEMLMPLPQFDIRNERKWGFYAASLGGTRTSSEQNPDHYGKLDTPFRDGSHIVWDAINLGMPAFVVWNDKYRRLDKPDRQWPPIPEEKLT